MYILLIYGCYLLSIWLCQIKKCHVIHTHAKLQCKQLTLCVTGTRRLFLFKLGDRRIFRIIGGLSMVCQRHQERVVRGSTPWKLSDSVGHRRQYSCTVEQKDVESLRPTCVFRFNHVIVKISTVNYIAINLLIHCYNMYCVTLPVCFQFAAEDNTATD